MPQMAARMSFTYNNYNNGMDPYKVKEQKDPPNHRCSLHVYNLCV